MGTFEVVAGEPGGAIRVEGAYDVGSYELTESYETHDDSSWVYRVRFGRKVSWIRHLFGDNAAKNRIRVTLPRNVPLVLEGFGYPVERDGARVALEGGHRLSGQEVVVPGDLSSAAFIGDGGLDVERDDILDAMVGAVCALHISECQTVGDPSEVDEEGLPMGMVYWPFSSSG